MNKDDARELMLSPHAEATGERFDAAMTKGEEGSVRIHDDDFTYDAHLKVSGDFGSAEEKWAYALELVGFLNSGWRAHLSGLSRQRRAPRAQGEEPTVPDGAEAKPAE